MAVPLLTKAIGGGMEHRFKDRVQETANHLLSDPIANGRDGQCELHLPTTLIWDSPRSVTLSTHFGVSGSKYSRNDAYRVSTL
jgi:hypothetical protein